MKEAVFDPQASDKLSQPILHRETGAVFSEPCLNYRITSKEMVFSAFKPVSVRVISYMAIDNQNPEGL